MIKELLIYGIGLLVVWLIAMRLHSVKARQVLYLIASWLFYYSWGAWLIVILIFSSLMNYALGEWLKKKITAGRLWVGILANLVLLSVFKYLPAAGARRALGSPLAFLKRIMFPIGVSFWTFEALSYLLEIYREEDSGPHPRRIFPLHVVLADRPARPDLPHVEPAAAIPPGLVR